MLMNKNYHKPATMSLTIKIYYALNHYIVDLGIPHSVGHATFCASTGGMFEPDYCRANAASSSTSKRREVAMGHMFSNAADACTWLYVQGYRQNDAGEWLKGNKRADINKSPANDGVVCVVVRKACNHTGEPLPALPRECGVRPFSSL
jgi:hypothetical protein